MKAEMDGMDMMDSMDRRAPAKLTTRTGATGGTSFWRGDVCVINELGEWRVEDAGQIVDIDSVADGGQPIVRQCAWCGRVRMADAGDTATQDSPYRWLMAEDDPEEEPRRAGSMIQTERHDQVGLLARAALAVVSHGICPACDEASRAREIKRYRESNPGRWRRLKCAGCGLSLRFPPSMDRLEALRANGWTRIESKLFCPAATCQVKATQTFADQVRTNFE